MNASVATVVYVNQCQRQNQKGTGDTASLSTEAALADAQLQSEFQPGKFIPGMAPAQLG